MLSVLLLRVSAGHQFCADGRADVLAFSEVVQCSLLFPFKYRLLIRLLTSVTLSWRTERSTLGKQSTKSIIIDYRINIIYFLWHKFMQGIIRIDDSFTVRRFGRLSILRRETDRSTDELSLSNRGEEWEKFERLNENNIPIFVYYWLADRH